MNRKTLLLTALALMVVAAGCDSEIDDKPAAVISEAVAVEAVDEAPAETEEDTTASREFAIDVDASSIGWVGAKVTGDHVGGFEDWTGTAVAKNGTLDKLSFDVDTRSIFSDHERLTGHLTSDDFFDVENYPESAFTSTRIVKTKDGDNDYEITGEFTIRGVTQTVTFPATIELSEDELKATSEFTINRFDFGIEYAGQPDDLIRDEVLLKIDLTAT